MACRRCSECVGMSHHWIPDPLSPDDPEWQPGDYACKHCEQRGNGCEACNGDGCIDGNESQPCIECSQEGVVPIADDEWIRAAAEDLHDSLNEIEAEAGQAAQAQQDANAGFSLWRERVIAIIQKYAPKAPAVGMVGDDYPPGDPRRNYDCAE